MHIYENLISFYILNLLNICFKKLLIITEYFTSEREKIKKIVNLFYFVNTRIYFEYFERQKEHF